RLAVYRSACATSKAKATPHAVDLIITEQRMSPDVIAKVQKLVRTIRRELPLRGEPIEQPTTLPIHREDVQGQSGPKSFADLLHPLPEQITPDGFMRRTPRLKQVEGDLRALNELLEGETDIELEYLRQLLKELKDTNVYYWHWTGSIPGEKREDGSVKPSP